MEDWCGELDMTKVPWTLRHSFIAGGTLESSIYRSQVGIIQPAFPRLLFLLVLVHGYQTRERFKSGNPLRTIVSGYSICCTLMFLISSGESSPNWISWIVRSGALEWVKLRFAIFALVVMRARILLHQAYTRVKLILHNST